MSDESMTETRAREILAGTSEYHSWDHDHNVKNGYADTACLDGEFTLEELQAMAWLMEHGLAFQNHW